ncbi:MAG: serine hydrolase, partial [Rhodocyclaceae bacterium]|nr:serine hydrolase [Rhodocyclaceae bacterium]
MRGLLLLFLLLPGLALAYPLDGERYTGIARLEGYRLAQENKASGRVQPPGGRLALHQVELRRAGSKLALPPPDAEFSRQVAELLGAEADRYAMAVLDLSDPARPIYAEHRAEVRFNPGSVGKLVVATALFQQLADLYPDDIAARERILRETQVVADSFIVSDSHAVPFWDGSRLAHRPLRQGDAASLWTYLDWMLSASSNAAASMVLRETLLLAGAGRAYPLDQARIDAFFRTHSKAELAALLGRALQGGIERNGLDPQALQQGGFFTHTGKARVPGSGSWATPRELMRWLLALEEGRIVDTWSSREIKRLLYMTQRRIRYASSPALDAAAVYFKSGSLFRCQPEPDFVCRKYQGNVENLLNSAAIVEHPAGQHRLHYLVVINSNVLRVNSAVAHQTLGTRLQRLLEKRHLAARSGVEHGLVHPDDQAAQPLAALGVLRQGHGDVAAAVAFDDGAVGMPVLPAAGFAEDLRTRALGLQALDEFVVDAGIAEDGLHLAGQLGRNEPPGLQQVVEARHLQGRRPVRKIVQGVAQGVTALAVGPAHPEAAVALGVVQAVAGRLQQSGQVAHADPLQHLAGGGIGGNTD